MRTKGPQAGATCRRPQTVPGTGRCAGHTWDARGRWHSRPVSRRQGRSPAGSRAEALEAAHARPRAPAHGARSHLDPVTPLSPSSPAWCPPPRGRGQAAGSVCPRPSHAGPPVIPWTPPEAVLGSCVTATFASPSGMALLEGPCPTLKGEQFKACPQLDVGVQLPPPTAWQPGGLISLLQAMPDEKVP